VISRNGAGCPKETHQRQLQDRRRRCVLLWGGKETALRQRSTATGGEEADTPHQSTPFSIFDLLSMNSLSTLVVTHVQIPNFCWKSLKRRKSISQSHNNTLIPPSHKNNPVCEMQYFPNIFNKDGFRSS
jgi:hypothetical protein